MKGAPAGAAAWQAARSTRAFLPRRHRHLPATRTIERSATYAVSDLDARRQVVSLSPCSRSRSCGRGAKRPIAVAPTGPGQDRRTGRHTPASTDGARRRFLAREDEGGMVTCIWPRTWERLRGIVRRHALVMVTACSSARQELSETSWRGRGSLVEAAAAGGRTGREAFASSATPACAVSVRDDGPMRERNCRGRAFRSRPRIRADRDRRSVFAGTGPRIGSHLEAGSPIDRRPRPSGRCWSRGRTAERATTKPGSAGRSLRCADQDPRRIRLDDTLITISIAGRGQGKCPTERRGRRARVEEKEERPKPDPVGKADESADEPRAARRKHTMR